MSLLDTFIQQHAGFLLTDAGVWDADGQLIGLESKLVTMPGLKIAIAVRGGSSVPIAAWPIWRSATARAPLLAELPVFAEHIVKINTEAASPGDRQAGSVEITAAFWDEAMARPRAIQMNTSPRGEVEGYASVLPDYQPFRWYELPEITLAPTFAAWDPAWPNLNDIADAERFDVRGCVGSIITAQRETLSAFRGNRVSTVAGWVDMAVITAAGVTVQRVVTWGDRASS